MDKISGELLSHGNLSHALRRMRRIGVKGNEGRHLPGIAQLLEQLRQLKHSQLDKYDLGSMIEEIRQKLKDILDKERQGIQRRLDDVKQKTGNGKSGLSPEEQEQLLKMVEDMAARNLQKLDELPSDLGGQIKELSQYDFMDWEAGREFKELMDMLKKHAMESYSRDLMQTIESMNPGSLANMREMLEALNRMLEQQLEGEEPDFDDFMSKFGSYFGPEPPRNFDELMERLQQQIAQAQSLMDSLSPENRQELQDLLRSMLDNAMQQELNKLANNLEELLPSDQDLGMWYRFSGEESISYNEALKLMESLQKMDRLESQLNQSQRHESLNGIDENLLKELMGDEAAGDLKRLRKITKSLEEAGYIRQVDNQWELTPRGIRKIGEKALLDIFAQLRKDRTGGHNLRIKGAGGEKLEETKKYESGDEFDIDLQKTIMNSVLRNPKAPPIKLSIDDFEIVKREGLTRTSVVILLDMSMSMFLSGYFDAAKRTAIALDTLIRSQYPKDSLHIIGFSLFAQVIKKKDLLYNEPDEYEQGTNIQHALSLARQLLAKEQSANTQIILISDGEPTAHLESGRAFFRYPPSLRTLQLTLNEASNCTHKGILINTFMFDNYDYSTNFVTRMAYLNRGRVFFVNADNLGKYVLFDYVARKKKMIW